jgi:hypothetical protein
MRMLDSVWRQHVSRATRTVLAANDPSGTVREAPSLDGGEA